MSKDKKHKKSSKKYKPSLPQMDLVERTPELYLGGCGTYIICFLFIITAVVFGVTPIV